MTIICSKIENSIIRRTKFVTLLICAVIISIFSVPYMSSGFRADQVLIPLIVLTFLLNNSVHKKALKVVLIGITILTLVPILLMLIRLNLPGFRFDLLFLIRELQNILKIPICFLFGYFTAKYVSETLFVRLVKIIVSLVLAFALVTAALSTLRLPQYTILMKLYHIHPFVAGTGRFPGILNQPATAGLFFTVMSYIYLLYKQQFSPIYYLMILLVGLLATSKVFIFSIPFLGLAYFALHCFSSRDPFARKERSRSSRAEMFLLLLFAVIGIGFVLVFFDLFLNSFSYLVRTISNDPLAGRGENFSAQSIALILTNFPFLGIGFALSEDFVQSAGIGLWDSAIYYDLYFYGTVGMFVKMVFLTGLFAQSSKSKPELILMIIMISNLFAIGLGIPVFGQERIGDFLWIFIGYRWTRCKLRIAPHELTHSNITTGGN
ncbi:MAG TPA: hypothetical protein P5539_15940 [Mesotoga sp.]|nr:hypothetical protein [Mesotoga sp.]